MTKRQRESRENVSKAVDGTIELLRRPPRMQPRRSGSASMQSMSLPER